MAGSSEIGAAVTRPGHVVLCGTCSWADRTLVQETDWYPARSMSAEDRLRFYAARFPIVEVDSTYYAPPAEQQSRLWAERTPDGFRFDVKAYSLLTGHPTKPRSLWRDVRDELPEEVLEKRNVYAHHLSTAQLDEAWRRFRDALAPLHEAGRLGAVLFQYPPWFTPRRDNRSEIERLRERLPDYRVSVELRSPRWFAETRDRERTIGLMRDNGLALVCVDAPTVSQLPRIEEVTDPDLFVMRFHGRSDDTWKSGAGSAAERFRYLYSEREIAELAAPLADTVEQARESHLLMNNCYRDYGVRNAAELRDALERTPPP